MKYHNPHDPEPVPKIFREQRLRLFEQLHQSPGEETMVQDGTWYRSSGGALCPHCQLTYRDHPLFDEYRYGNTWEELTDHRLCNGDVIHP